MYDLDPVRPDLKGLEFLGVLFWEYALVIDGRQLNAQILAANFPSGHPLGSALSCLMYTYVLWRYKPSGVPPIHSPPPPLERGKTGLKAGVSRWLA